MCIYLLNNFAFNFEVENFKVRKLFSPICFANVYVKIFDTNKLEREMIFHEK